MKPFKTVDNQIKILQSRNLNIDLPDADRLLLKYGYYNIVNGYNDLFLADDGLLYKDNVFFSDVYRLFSFDKSLRYFTLSASEEIEIALKTALSYVIAKNFGVFEDDYLNLSNYKAGRYNPEKRETDRDFILNKLRLASNFNNNPYKHYRENHGHIPPWILLNALTFGNLHKFYKLQKSNIKTEVLDIILKERAYKDKQLFNDLVYVIYKFRNQAAHLGRLYNYNLKNLMHGSNISYNNVFHNFMGIDSALYRQEYGRSDYYTFLNAIKFIDENYFINVLKPGMLLIFTNFSLKNNLTLDKLILEMGFPSMDHFNDLLKTNL